MTEAADLDGLLARLARERRDDPEDHPGSEKLSAYQAGELSPEEDEAIQEHVANCRLCADRLLELQRFLEPLPEDRSREGVADFETEVEWRKLRKKASPKPGRVRQIFGSLRTAYGLAAVLLLVSGTLLVKLSRPQPSVNTFAVPLSSSVGVRGPGDEVTEVDVPPSAERVLFSIGSSRGGYSSYSAEMFATAGRDRVRIWRTSGLQEMDGAFTFELPRRALSPGDYEIQVFGLRNGKEQLVAAATVRLRFLAPADVP